MKATRFLGALLFVGVATRRRSDDCENDHTKEREKQNDAEPGGERRARLGKFANGLGIGHVSFSN